MSSSQQVIDALFDRTVDIVQSLPTTGPIQTTYEEKLALYSLYKQATEGDVRSKRPGMLDMLGRAKWDAWAKRKGLSSQDSKQLYVESMLRTLRKFSDRPQAIELIEELENYSGDVAQQVMSGTLARATSDSGSSGPSRPPSPPAAQRRPRTTQISQPPPQKQRPQENSYTSDSDDDSYSSEVQEQPAASLPPSRVQHSSQPTSRSRTTPGSSSAGAVAPPLRAAPPPARRGPQLDRLAPDPASSRRIAGNVTPSSVGDISAAATRGGRRRNDLDIPQQRAHDGVLSEETESETEGSGSETESDEMEEVVERDVYGPVQTTRGAAPPGRSGANSYRQDSLGAPYVPPRGPGWGPPGSRPYGTGPPSVASRFNAPPSEVGGAPGSLYGAGRSETHHYHRPSEAGVPGSLRGPYASSSVGGRSAGGRSGGAGGSARPPASVVGPPPPAVRPEVEAALQSIQASLAALHERLNRVETTPRQPVSLLSLLTGSGTAASGSGANSGGHGRRSALRNAYLAVANALHDIGVLVGLRQGSAGPAAPPPSYLVSGGGGGSGGAMGSSSLVGGSGSSRYGLNAGGGTTTLLHSSASAPLRLLAALTNLLVRLLLDVTSFALLLSLALAVLRRITGRGDPYFVLRLLRMLSKQGRAKRAAAALRAAGGGMRALPAAVGAAVVGNVRTAAGAKEAKSG